MKEQNACLILDVATSGISAEKHTILEVATILVDVGTLDVIEVGDFIINHPPEVLEKVPEFHRDLALECADPNRPSMSTVEGALLAGPWTCAHMLINRNLWFDLKFLGRHMPTLVRSLPGRHMDLCDLTWLHRARGVPPYEPGPRTFRASDDAIDTYMEMLHFLRAR